MSIEQKFLNELDTKLWKAVDQKEDTKPFPEKMAPLIAQLKGQFIESGHLEAKIKKGLGGLGYEL